MLKPVMNAVAQYGQTTLLQQDQAAPKDTSKAPSASPRTDRVPTDPTIQLSVTAYQRLSSSEQHPQDTGLKQIIQRISDDSAFAKEMAYQYAYSRDAKLVDLRSVSLDASNLEAHLKSTAAFERQADSARNQRMAIYNDMTAKGAGGAEIFAALMDYNRTLPSAYLSDTGLDRLLAAMD